MTIRLHGHPISNYYNKAKMALLEKGVPFEEVLAKTGRTDEELLALSPLGKIPFLTLDDGRSLCESQVIVDWLEAAHPNPPLVPADPYEAAKVRELATFVDWHLEMTARQLYGAAFFGQEPPSEKNAARIRKELETRIAAFKRIAKFAPYVAGAQFTIADCSAANSLPLVGLSTKAVYGEDLLLAAGVDYKSYVKTVSERPAAQKVLADRKAAQATPLR